MGLFTSISLFTEERIFLVQPMLTFSDEFPLTVGTVIIKRRLFTFSQMLLQKIPGQESLPTNKADHKR